MTTIETMTADLSDERLTEDAQRLGMKTPVETLRRFVAVYRRAKEIADQTGVGVEESVDSASFDLGLGEKPLCRNFDCGFVNPYAAHLDH